MSFQVLRDHRFDSNCLVRRSAPSEDIELMVEKKNGDDSDCSGGPNKEVVLWTNHRVMEWLRVVDLAEYAPNLRGSGKTKNWNVETFKHFASFEFLIIYFIFFRCSWGFDGS